MADSPFVIAAGGTKGERGQTYHIYTPTRRASCKLFVPAAARTGRSLRACVRVCVYVPCACVHARARAYGVVA